MNIQEELLKNLKVFAAINGFTVKDYIVSLIEKDMSNRNICIYNYSHKPNKKTKLAIENKKTTKLQKVKDVWKGS